MGKDVKRVFKKMSLKPNSDSQDNASWYTDDTDGILEHSPSGGSLSYKGPALPRFQFFGPPFICSERSIMTALV